VRLTRIGDRSIGQVALDLDLTETNLRDWVKRADADVGEGPPETLTSAERAELTRLRRENKRLQMERDILKLRPPLREGERMMFAFIALKEVAFRPDYPEASLRNQSFSSIKGSGRFVEGSAGSEVHPAVAPKPGDVVVTKHRLSAFVRRYSFGPNVTWYAT
jgi:transposase